LDSEPLTLGEERTGRLDWQSADNGTQKLTVISDDENDDIVFAGVFWYIDPDYSMGPLSLPLPGRTLRKVLTAPPLDPVEAADVCLTLSKIDSCVPAPKDFKIEIDSSPPKVNLLLAAEEADPRRHSSLGYYYEDNVPIARLSFDYGDTKFEHPDEIEHREFDGKAIKVRKRDMKLEKTSIAQLMEWRLRVLPRGKAEETCERTFGLLKPEEKDWLQFSADLAPLLQEQGWNVQIDPSFPYQVVVPEEDWSVEATESSAFWFSVNLDITVDGKKTPLLPILQEALKALRGKNPISELERLNSKGTFYAPLGDGRLVALPFERVKVIVETLVELFDKEYKLKRGKMETSLPQVVGLFGALKGPRYNWQIAERLKTLTARIKEFEGLVSSNPPKSFKGTLRPYQSEGLSWLNFLSEFGLGGILADDMGLGKTIQTLAHVVCEKDQKRLQNPVLVVCPTSVLPNWLSEIERFAPKLKSVSFWGADRVKSVPQIEKSDIVVTTYPVLGRDAETFFLRRDWHAVILDEAQNIKNPETIAAQTACKLKCNYRLCLTGTPVENHLGELWSQFNFALPGFLSSHSDFKRIFRNPIEKEGDRALQKILAARIRPFLVRRTKELVAKELPAKTEIVKSTELEGAQRDLYETVRLAMYEKVKQAVESKGLAKSQIIILDALLKLRQVCCDPRLVAIPAAKKVRGSAKLDLLLGMLEELLAENKRILLFSQFTSMLDLIVPELQKRNLSFVEIRGDTKDRATPVRQFQAGNVPLFLLSLKAGGLGLNLTKADTVIHYDPWWNPAVENQATDRAHRIGQKQAVFVFKLIAAGTIEERMRELQERKRILAEGIYQDPSGNASPALTTEDLECLFSPLC